MPTESQFSDRFAHALTVLGSGYLFIRIGMGLLSA